MELPERANQYRAIVFDLDGTLIPDDGKLRPQVIAKLQEARDKGIIVLVATGRSSISTLPILQQLQLGTSALTFNGVAVYDPTTESHTALMRLSRACITSCIDYATRHESLCVVMEEKEKYCLGASSQAEKLALRDMTQLIFASEEQIRNTSGIRISLFSDRHQDSRLFANEVREQLSEEVFMTHFPLRWLAQHRDNPLIVVDVQPASKGKGEVFTYLEQQYGIAASECVTVGDSTNDIEMLEPAGLGVAMSNAAQELLPYADRVIGNANSDTIADLVDELFLS